MEQITIQNEVAPESEEYLQEMASKGEAAVEAGNTHSTGSNPSIPDKFKDENGEINAEALLKSYQELEKRLSGKQTEPTPQEEAKTEQEQPKQSLNISSVEDARKVAQEKGIDFEELTKEYQSNNESLSQETYQKLAEKGISKEVVDQFIDGQKAVVENLRNEVFKTVGGKDQYAEMVSWAKDNLDQADIEAFNQAINTNNPAFVKLAVSSLQQRYVQANGNPPKGLLGGKTIGDGSAVKPFRSRAEYVDAVSDKRYERDPAYRQDVIDRLQLSSIF